jgi:hypothetical protein
MTTPLTTRAAGSANGSGPATLTGLRDLAVRTRPGASPPLP